MKKAQSCRFELVTMVAVEACAFLTFFHDGEPFMVAGMGFVEFGFAHFCVARTPGFEVDGFDLGDAGLVIDSVVRRLCWGSLMMQLLFLE